MRIYNIDRKTPIKKFEDLSILKGLNEAKRCDFEMMSNELFVIQLAVISDRADVIRDIRYSGEVSVECINRDCVDKFGRSYTQDITIKGGEIQPLFFIVDATKDMNGNALDYAPKRKFSITIISDNADRHIDIVLNISKETLRNRGCDDLWRLSRLSWLNSRRFHVDEVSKPYTQPLVEKNVVKILGRDIVFNDMGLPEQIIGHYDESIRIFNENRQLFSKPMEFVTGENIIDVKRDFKCGKSYVDVSASANTDSLEICVNGRVNYEGFLDYSIQITALKDCRLKNIALNTYLNNDCAKYINGLGEYGGRYKDIDFKWSNEKHVDSLYIGDVNLGMRMKWKAEDYVKPLVNIYYHNMPLAVPRTTWDNNAKGKIDLTKGSECTQLSASTNEFTLQSGEVRKFNFEIHITPLKPIDYKKHYSVRYSHNNGLKNEFKEIDRAKKKGLNNIVVHHGNMIHPFINYPFIEAHRLKNMVDYARNKSIGVKVYYTTREHSNHMAEVFAYKALGDEIILRKKGNGYNWKGGTSKWLNEYFGEEVIPAWKVEYRYGKYKNDPDVSFIVRPNSRLDNYYIEGLDWLVRNIGIKGIYIDDTALDRTTLERARKVLAFNDGLIDMHMWNHEEYRAGDTSCMNLYTEIFPFIDSLWIGEGYPYKKLTPEYLLTEVSGIPYGQTSQMLEGGGEPYIGMLYAMNNRYGWGAMTAPRIYKLWDDFGIQDSEMRGYWHTANPVTLQNDDIKCTVYIKEKSALVCLYNFSDDKKSFVLNIDNAKLGFVPKCMQRVKIESLQSKKSLHINDTITLKGKKGIILELCAENRY